MANKNAKRKRERVRDIYAIEDGIVSLFMVLFNKSNVTILQQKQNKIKPN